MIHPFTPTYIAMAKASVEIEKHSPSLQDLLAGRAAGHAYLTATGVLFIGSDTPFEKVPVLLSWLPLLHQLLGMLGAPEAFLRAAVYSDPDEDDHLPGFTEAYYRFEDWHELALAVVMREKHGKVWDGKGWVKVS